ncbi:DEAD/DEAH box helicase [Oceanicella actignis]|uniref:DEAD-box ATP-dependent RNA helicase RhpA n=1 Tax=Oceanicella actignis TaxID=1189325 RepID=A0A1M7RX45_9RHOB|nr:DEAD/DEAH box helicase [Oceanicella actignis]SES99702.1 Superfamily II DNA and RNA helicase [Oceanicella actignis]SHN50602.1 Superfamily II DNA and RNA helicase [Oceanicella actignis]
MKFSDLDLDPKVLQAIEEAGYETPTPIQQKAIPEALKGRDVLGIAQTGTGKTAAFTLPMISILAQGRARARMPRSLVLCPTRELAAQVAENFEIYGKYHKLSMALLIGGVSFKDQDRLIDRGVDVLIATPGRLLDHFERGKLMLTGVQIMVVDEADRMLDMGFIPDIERIFSLTPFTRQTLFFSATMPPEITRLTEQFLHAPVRVEVARQSTTGENIEQRVCELTPSRKDRADSEKRAALRALMRAEGEALKNAIIFCNRKRDVSVLHKSLLKHGFNAGALHGDLDQSVRMRVLNGFRDGEIQILVASDVAARGLDIPSVSHVFNFDVPIHSEDYVHRIGRTGRAGRKGVAVTLCLPHEQKHLDKIEELVKATIPRVPSPLAAPAPAPEGEAPEAEARPRRRGRRKSAAEAAAEAAPAPPPAAERAPEPDAAPKAAAPEAPAPDAPSPRPARARRGEGKRAEPSAQQDEAPAPRARPERRRGGQVVGLGDHVPAFLLQPINVDELIAASARDEDPEEEEADAPSPAEGGPSGEGAAV